jgi:Xaa-Pro aminopeptidase
MFDLAAIQAALQQFRIDGWLLYDFRGANPLARRVARIPDGAMLTRRWFYFIPARGEPRKLQHRIEPHALDHLPGAAASYLQWQQLEKGVGDLVRGAKTVAMEYVPRNANPYVSRVDAGTIELVKSCGVDVMPSGDLIQMFEACWDADQWAMHLEATKYTTAAYDIAWRFIGERTRGGGSVRETEVQECILANFSKNGMITDHPPIVGAGPHSGDPHYEPREGSDAEIKRGSFVLVDLWGKLDRPRAVYSDLTRVAFVGGEPSAKHSEVFKIVAAARDAAIEQVRAAFAHDQELRGWQVDRAARDVIEKAGYGDYFIHRTGHSIGEEDHGNGANMDDLETHEMRLVLPRTCFSIEPGIYLPEFGVRSEVNVYIDGDRGMHVTGELQREIVRIN